MARKRMLSPEFFTSSTINALSIPAMVTFAGLWTYCDDYGRGENDTTLIKAAVWPRRRKVTEKHIAAHLTELATGDLICRHVVAGYELLHIISWHEHQKISHRTPSKLPPCQSHEPGQWESFANGDDPALAKFRRLSGAARERLHDSKEEVSRGKRSSGAEAQTPPEVIRSIRATAGGAS